MIMFGKRHQKFPEAAACACERAGEATNTALENPFTAIPMRPADVELRRDSRGLIHLRRREALSGLRRRVADWLRYDYARKLELDEYGTLYYGLVDGTHTLHMIVDAFAAAPSPRPRQDIERAVVLFTRKLMTMNMLALKISTRATL